MLQVQLVDDRASVAIDRVVRDRYLRTADGRLGHPPGAPYDRLVAWAQAPHAIPAAWTGQVRLGGIISLPA